MRTRTVVVAMALALLAALVAAPAALAARTTVRVEGAAARILGVTAVSENGGTYKDTGGDAYTSTQATPFGALALALARGGLPWDFGVASFGVFVNSIDGQAMAPDYKNWWEFSVDGYAPPVGIAGMPSLNGDSYVLFQNPDAGYPPHGAKLLVVRASRRGLTPGRPVTIAVVGDDLAKVNSQADATRFGATALETPAQFPAIAGATLHVGSRVYALTGSSITISDLPRGTFGVWAEKAMDATWVYARSSRTLIDVAPAPVVSRLAVTPRMYRRGHELHIGFALSKAAQVRVTVRNAFGVILFSKVVNYGAGGAKQVTWSGRTLLRTGSYLHVTVAAVDSWGRTGAAHLRVPVAW
jgi:hypothetical protein